VIKRPPMCDKHLPQRGRKLSATACPALPAASCQLSAHMTYKHTRKLKPKTGPEISGGLSPNSWGARWAPSRSQVPSKEHMQLGWVVHWVLSPPTPGPPRGWAVRPCRASTSLAPLYSPCASSAFGWGPKPPLPFRASSRGVLPGADALAGYRTPIQPVCFTKAAALKSKPIRVMHLVALRRLAQAPPVAKRSNERWRMGLFQTPSKAEAHRCVPLAFFHHISNHKSPRLTHSRDVSPPTPAQRRRTSEMGVFQTLGHGL
jgi:hypothetical protein